MLDNNFDRNRSYGTITPYRTYFWESFKNMSALLRAGFFACAALSLPSYSQTPSASVAQQPHLKPRPVAGISALTALERVIAITYHGGPVMLGTTHVYFIWYGDWSGDLAGKTILRNFANSIGGSPHYAINTTYYDASSNFVSKSVTLAGEVNDSYSQGLIVGQIAAVRIVSAAIAAGLPKDPNGVYFVLTSDDVIETSGYCGYHYHYQNEKQITDPEIKYAVVPKKTPAALANCAEQTAFSPNSNPAVDAMVNVMAHELEEAVTDPNIDAWFDSRGDENADKCAWTFGNTFLTANGSKANITLGGYNYLIQQNWVNASGGYCAMNLTDPVITSINPEVASRGSTVSVAITGFNLTGASINPMAGITISNSVKSAELVTATFFIDPNASLGIRNLSLTSATGTTNKLNFSVIPLAPILNNINPSSGTQGTSVAVTLTGSNLAGGSISVGDGISLSGLISTANQISVTFSIPLNAPAGPQFVTVTTTGGTSNALTFNINSPLGPPALYSMDPLNGTQGSSINVSIAGTNFTNPTSILMVDPFSVTVSNIVIVSSNLLMATLNIASFAARRNSLKVQTPLGTSNSLNFDVLPGLPNQAPMLLFMNPTSIGQGQSVPVTISGNNLNASSINPIAGVTMTILAASATQISAMFTVAAGATLGARSITVTNLNGTSNALTFSITSSTGLALTNITPPSGAPSAVVPVVISGNGLTGGLINPIIGVTITTVAVTSTQIVATFSIAAGAAVGPRNVTVNTAAGASNALVFTITGSGPMLTSLTPNSGRPGTSLQVSILGINLGGASINSIPGITITNLVTSATAVTAIFDIAPNVIPGMVAVTVNTASGVSNALAFEVKPIRDAR